MKFLIVPLLFLVVAGKAQDSAKVAMAFRISDYIVKSNDSMHIVQVQLPEVWPLRIQEKQLGLLKSLYRSEPDFTAVTKGNGRCQLIKGNYYYFGLHTKPGNEPAPGDLLYTLCTVPVQHNGYLFKTALHSISFQRVTEDQFYNTVDVFTLTQQQEDALLDSMVADIRFTGNAMLEQMPDNNQLISGGIFNGKKIFSAMQELTRQHLISFLKYIIARPEKYAGHNWKISEITATWMVSKTPEVVEK